MGRPDDWLGIYDRSINPGFRFPFERIPSCHLQPGAATRHLRMGLLSLNLSLTGEMIYSLPFPRGFHPAQAAPSAPPRADDPAASAPAGGDLGRSCARAGAGTEA